MPPPIADGTSNTVELRKLSQDGRDGRLHTPLDPDVLVLTHFNGAEGISQLFEYQVEALSEIADIDLDKLLGKPCSVRLKTPLGVYRYFHGHVTEGQWLGMRGNYYAYRLILRPWLWLLGRRSNTRIFKKMDPLSICKEVFKDHGFTDYEIRANSSELKELEYCVQYRETDLGFLCRLMEEWGLYTYFEHAEKKHTLVINNQRSSHLLISADQGLPPALVDPPPSKMTVEIAYRAISRQKAVIPPGSFPLLPRENRAGPDLQHLVTSVSGRSFRTGKVTLNDFDYAKPSASLLAETETSETYGSKSYEAYNHPGRYDTVDIGKRLAKISLEAEQAADRRFYLSGLAPSLVPGGYFKLSGKGEKTEDYLVIRAVHHFGEQTYETGAVEAAELYRGEYEVMKHDRQFRAPMVTPRPVVIGPQTATVTNMHGNKKGRRGQGKDWIDVDDQGRILVRFHWDRATETALKFSRRVRVAQMWADTEWGWQVIPRVGQEVIVTFLNGDPDQPLVVGAVYNEDNKHPYAPGPDVTISGVKTQTEVGSPGYNELAFDDRKEGERVRIHAQRYYDVDVRDQETVKIGVDNRTGIARKETLVLGDEILDIEKGNRTETLKKGNDSLTLMEGNQSTVLERGNQSTELKMGNQSTKLSLGDYSLDVTGSITIKATLGIKLECAASSIEMTPASITVSSPSVTLDGKAMTEVKGAAMVTVKGGIVMIN